MRIRIALIGFGTVGQGVAALLSASTAERAGSKLEPVIVGVYDPRFGGVYDRDGLDADALLAAAGSGSFEGIDGAATGWDALALAANADYDLLVELSPTDLRTGEPAASYLRAALTRGRCVSTTNKGPVALHRTELDRLAAEHDGAWAYEGTVMSGTPVLRLARELLAPAGIERIEGVLNGTTNYILDRIASGAAYPDALAEAQRLGYAETDPAGDVDGHDAAAKIAILASLLLGAEITPGMVAQTGIRGIDEDVVRAAAAAGNRIRLVARADRTPAGVTATVGPRRLHPDHPLHGVAGVTNAVVFGTRLLGDVTIAGPGAGREATAFAVLEDLRALAPVIAAKETVAW